MKYYIKTFGCQQNLADSERLAGYYKNKGYSPATTCAEADLVIINTCMIRQKAEDKIYGVIGNLNKLKKKKKSIKIILTGCLVGTAVHDSTGRIFRTLKRRLPDVDEFLPIEEVRFDHESIRHDKKHALVPISNGCNNFCTFCIVPFSRGREISRPFDEIVKEVDQLAKRGYTQITLLGQNVNSYGSDLVKINKEYILPEGQKVKPVIVKHLSRLRIPTLFPFLLEQICTIRGINYVSFISSNPWDFSDELIAVIKRNKNIDRTIHLPVQAGDNKILKRMNRWYTRDEYIKLIKKIRRAIPEAEFVTDIIVGFPGETKEAFEKTVQLAREVKFAKAFIACYSPRPGTAAAQHLPDHISMSEKKRRFRVLDKLINHHHVIKEPVWLRPR